METTDGSYDFEYRISGNENYEGAGVVAGNTEASDHEYVKSLIRQRRLGSNTDVEEIKLRRRFLRSQSSVYTLLPACSAVRRRLGERGRVLSEGSATLVLLDSPPSAPPLSPPPPLAPTSSALASGDVHLFLPQGEHADFRGSPGKIYNLLSAFSLSVSFQVEEALYTLHGATVNGTFMTQVHIVARTGEVAGWHGQRTRAG